jgi:predicted acetyltransferase
MQLYLYDFAEFDDRRPDRDGRFEYRWLDAYWTDDDRHPYLLRVGGSPAGFALVRDTTVADTPRTSPFHELAEFFVLRTHRGRGIGKAAAQRVLRLHPGSWRITEVAHNAPAIAFWRRTIPVEFAETVLPDGTREQRFEII